MNLDQWFTNCGPWAPGGLQTESRGLQKDDYNQSKVCEYPQLQFKRVHKWKTIEKHWLRISKYASYFQLRAAMSNIWLAGQIGPMQP